jgi:Zn-dependent protease with chaperone function
LEFRTSRAIGPNAFALPGGIIVITDELVALAKSDDELLAVLAHELGHVRLRHTMRRLLESSAVAMLIAGITGDIASTSSLAASAPAVLLQSKFSRDNETEADRFAFDLMRRAGIDPKYFAVLLARLEAKRGPGPFPAFLSSHPPSAERNALALAASVSAPREKAERNEAAGK